MRAEIKHKVARPSARSLRTEISIRDVAKILGLKSDGEAFHSTIDLVADVLSLPIGGAIHWLAEKFPAAAGKWTTVVEAEQKKAWIDPKHPERGTTTRFSWKVPVYLDFIVVLSA